MPRNGAGVMSLPAGNPVVPGTLIESTWANPTMSDIANEITQSLPRNGAAGMTGPLMCWRDGELPKEAATYGQLQAAIGGQNNYQPAGAIQAFAMSAVPTGWLECNGAAISRTTYANLFNVIGTTYGAGNGTTTFNIPDLRGEFVRGWDHGRSVDPGRNLGSSQSAANASHTHILTDPGHTHSQPAHTHGVSDPGHSHVSDISGVGQQYDSGGGPVPYRPGGSLPTSINGTGISIQNSQPAIAASSSGVSLASEGTEARPRNVALMYCIKAFGALQVDGLGSMAFQNADAVNITGGSGVFSSLKSNKAPTDPTDVVRLSDIGGTMTDINCDDTQIILLDKTNPNVPIMRPQVNKPFGTVKLDAYGKIPSALLDPNGYNYQGTWSAAGGTLPGGVQLDGSMYSISVAGTLNLFHEDGLPHPTVCAVGSRIVYVTDSPTLPVPNWYYEPAPTLTGATASQVSFIPTGGISALDVQGALVELDTEKESTANKGVINGYASLDGSGKVPDAQLPTTDHVAEGASNLYFTMQRVRDSVLTGLSTASSAAIAATDTVLAALGKLQAQITGYASAAITFTNKRYGIGSSGTATQNFTLTAEAADGTMKLARGNPGATSADIFTVSSTNAVVGNMGLGAAQTPQNMTGLGGRTVGVDITNTSGRTIWVSVQGTMNAVGANISLLVGGIQMDVSQVTTVGYVASVKAPVPAGAIYRVNQAGGVLTITIWAEIRA